MSLRPTDIPQLQNMGLSPAASMINTGISTAIGADQREKDRRMDLIRSILGGGVDIGTQLLNNRGKIEQTALENQIAQNDIGIINEALKKQNIDFQIPPGVSGVTARSLLYNVGLPGQLKYLKGLGDITTTASGLGDAETAAIAGSGFSQGVQRLLNQQGQSLNKENIQLSTATQSTTGEPIKAGLVAEGEQPNNLILEKAKAVTKQQQIKTQEAEQQALPQNFAQPINKIKSTEMVDVNGLPLTVNPKEQNTASKIQRNYARFPKQELAKQGIQLTQQFNKTQDIERLVTDYVNARKQGLLDRQRVNAAIKGLLPFDKLTDAERVAVELDSKLGAMALSKAAAEQGGRNVSDIDFTAIKNSIGDVSKPINVFLSQVSGALADSYANFMYQGVALDSEIYNQTKERYKALTGQDISLNDSASFNKLRINILKSLKQGGNPQMFETPQTGQVSPTTQRLSKPRQEDNLLKNAQQAMELL